MGCLMDVPHQSRLVDLLIGRIEIVFPSNWTSPPFKYPKTSLTSTFLLSFHVCTYKSVSLCNHTYATKFRKVFPASSSVFKNGKTLFYHNISSFYARCKCSSTKSVLFPKVHTLMNQQINKYFRWKFYDCMRGYSVNPRVSPVCGGSVLTIDGIDTNLVREQEITILG